MCPRGSKEPAQPRITLSVHLRQELVHGSAGESEAGTTSGVGRGGLPGLAPGTDVRSPAATPGSGLWLELTRKARSQRVRSPRGGPDNKKRTQGPEAREQNEEQSARRAVNNQRGMGPTFIGQWLPWRGGRGEPSRLQSRTVPRMGYS